MGWLNKLFGLDLTRLVSHVHEFGQWSEVTIPIGPYPYHTKEIMRSCVKCRGVQMMFGCNWNLVPEEYKNKFRENLAENNLHLLVDNEEIGH